MVVNTHPWLCAPQYCSEKLKANALVTDMQSTRYGHSQVRARAWTEVGRAALKVANTGKNSSCERISPVEKFSSTTLPAGIDLRGKRVQKADKPHGELSQPPTKATHIIPCFLVRCTDDD